MKRFLEKLFKRNKKEPSEQDSETLIIPDHPIANAEQDQLRRAPLAKKVAEIINRADGNESFVIGIEGVWGSGKTSFINLVLTQVDTEKITYLVFNPWNFSDETSLLRDFFTQLSSALEKVVGRRFGKRLRGYAARIADIDLGVSLYGFSVNPLKWFGFLARDLSLNGLRKDLDKELKKIDKKIVVVIDDIDRLDQDETKLIFKLVKLTANFPNTIFVLSYDREQVEKRITDKDAGIEGGDYLRKIVQVSFTLPVPEQKELRGILLKDLDKTIKDLYPDEEILKNKQEEERWSELLHHGFGDLFQSVRDIKRYISSLRLDWSIVGTTDVNKIDFLGIEAIRVFAPLFYNAIPANEDVFIQSPRSRRIFPDESKEAEDRKKRFQLLLEEYTSPKERDHIEALCGKLFPRVDRYGGHYSEETQEREMMICHPDRFRFYFQLGIPHGEVSEDRVQTIIDLADDIEELRTLILQSKTDGNLRRVLRRLLMRRSELGETKIKNILFVLWDLEDDISEDREAIFDFDDVDTQVMRFGYHALQEVPEATRAAFLIELFKSSTQLYQPMHLLHVLVDSKRSGEINLDDATVAELKKIMVKKFEVAAQDGTLKNKEQLIAILYRWQKWGSKKVVYDFIKKWVSTRKGLLEFLQRCVSRVLSTNGNYNDLNPDSIAGLYSLDDIKKKVAAISEEDIKKMNDKEKEAVELFKNRPDRFK